MAYQQTIDTFNIRQMIFNMCGKEISSIMAFDTPSEEIENLIKGIETKTGFKIGKVLQHVEGNLLLQ